MAPNGLDRFSTVSNNHTLSSCNIKGRVSSKISLPMLPNLSRGVLIMNLSKKFIEIRDHSFNQIKLVDLD